MSSLSSVTHWSTGLGLFLTGNIWRSFLQLPLEYQSLLLDGLSRAELHNQSPHGFHCLFSRTFREYITDPLE